MVWIHIFLWIYIFFYKKICCEVPFVKTERQLLIVKKKALTRTSSFTGFEVREKSRISHTTTPSIIYLLNRLIQQSHHVRQNLPMTYNNLPQKQGQAKQCSSTWLCHQEVINAIMFLLRGFYLHFGSFFIDSWATSFDHLGGLLLQFLR